MKLVLLMLATLFVASKLIKEGYSSQSKKDIMTKKDWEKAVPTHWQVEPVFGEPKEWLVSITLSDGSIVSAQMKWELEPTDDDVARWYKMWPELFIAQKLVNNSQDKKGNDETGTTEKIT